MNQDKKIISIFEIAGSFAENKDVARDIRVREIMPALQKKEGLILDFNQVEAVTQSFIHALISDAIREHEDLALELITFKSCNETVRKIISIVVDYMQAG